MNLSKLLEYLDLTVIQQFHQGNVCDGVYLVKDTTKPEHTLVLKVATSEKQRRELLSNLSGFYALREMCKDTYLPTPYIHEARFTKTDAYLLMDYAGDNFETRAFNTAHPEVLYDTLWENLAILYQSTLRTSTEGRFSIERIVAIMESAVMTLPIPFDHVQAFIELLQQFQYVVADLSTVACFSNWNMTPDDTYVSFTGKVFVSDLPAQITGIPIIDLACFMGVARDVLRLPGAATSYPKFEQYALLISDLLGIRPQTGEKLFLFGRGFQSLMSAYVRKTSDLANSEKYFQKAFMYLERAKP